MVLQILADPAQRHFRVDAVRAQFLRIADAGQHQGLRRVDGAAGQNDLALGMRDLALAVLQILDADGARALEHDARHQRAGLDPQIGATERGPQIADRCAAPMPVTDRHLDAREAMLLGAVVVGGRRMPGIAPGFEIGIDQRIGIARGLDRERPVAAAIRIRAALPCLLPPEVRKHIGVRPAGQAGRGPAIVVGAVAAHIRHGVDRGRAADHLAARAFDAAIVERRLRLGLVVPAVDAVAQHLAPREGQLDPRVAIPAAGLEQQHVRRILGQPRRKRAAGRAGADNDVIDVLHADTETRADCALPPECSA